MQMQWGAFNFHRMEGELMIENIGEFLANSSNIYLFLAIFGSVIFILQFILSLAGLHGETDFDADFQVDAHDVSDIHGLNFFSIKSIVAFITFFGWAGYFFADRGWGGLGIAFLSGAVMMALTSLVLWLLLKMQQSGNVSTQDMIGRRGVVYLTLPAERGPGGLVTVTLPDRTRQISARSDEELKTGTEVVIESDLGGGLFLVRRLD